MHLTLDLMHVVNGSPLVELLDWLSLYRRKVAILFAKDPLGLGSPSFGVLPQCHHPMHLSVL